MDGVVPASANTNSAPFAGPNGPKVSIESAGGAPVPCGVSQPTPASAATKLPLWRDPESPESTTMMFSTLGLPAPLFQATRAAGLNEPTPIQAKAIPVILQGNDLIGNAPSGSGKTGAFL
ncbi:MAG TPA: DEAD/DEAH box helicase, partial [Gemmatimonadaceae bacterium]|nr:DEAD/DEAH box helicase [Gemmatimonadaceae bacterium]